MAANNLRIIYKNLADISTITCNLTPIGTTSLANLKVDTKALVCRTTGTSVTFTFTLPSAQIVGGIVFPFCNLTSTATATVKFDTVTVANAVTVCPYQALGVWDWGAIPLGANGYAYGRGTYARVWIPAQPSVTVIEVTITDTSNTAGYLEFSRAVVGAFWSPTYNTSFGLGTSVKDLSNHERSEAGDLITNRGVRFSSMSFDLKYLNPSDRMQMTTILKGGGLANPLLISLFPDNSEDWAREQTYQIYGKLPQLGEIVHPMFEMYTTQIEIEEL